MSRNESSMGENEAAGVIARCRGVLERWRGKGILAVYVYGSILGPRHRSDSDVDLAVLDQRNEPLRWTEQSMLMDEFERAIRMPVDLRMLRDCTLSHQAHILEHGELVWITDKAAVDEFARDVLTRYASHRERTKHVWSSTLRDLMSSLMASHEPRLPR